MPFAARDLQKRLGTTPNCNNASDPTDEDAPGGMNRIDDAGYSILLSIVSVSV
jgi:hypothetical protein